jgi:hypothetical protein
MTVTACCIVTSAASAASITSAARPVLISQRRSSIGMDHVPPCSLQATA